jgi:hypothetical protein
LPLVFGHLEEGFVRTERGVVQQRIDRAERRDRLIGNPLALLGLANVAHDDERLDAELLCFLRDPLAGGSIARAVDRNVEAVFRQAEHAGAPDVLAGAGDEGGLAVRCHQTTPPARSFSIAGLS